jgi:hypothetical protein
VATSGSVDRQQDRPPDASSASSVVSVRCCAASARVSASVGAELVDPEQP